MAKKIPDLKELTKGEIRKLNALRKSIGDDIAHEAFAKWLELKQQEAPEATDKNAALIKDALQPLIEKKSFDSAWRLSRTARPRARHHRAGPVGKLIPTGRRDSDALVNVVLPDS